MKNLYYEDLFRQEQDDTIINTLLRKGWTECPDFPAYDEATQVPRWENRQWVIVNFPNPPVPDEIPLWAFRAILRVNNLKNNVDAMIDSLPEPTKSLALEQYEYGNYIVRNHPLVVSLGEQLGLTSTDIDNLFISAKQLV